VHPEVVGKASGRTNLTDGLQVWKPARQQTWKSAGQKIRKQRRVAPGWQCQMIIKLTFPARPIPAEPLGAIIFAPYGVGKSFLKLKKFGQKPAAGIGWFSGGHPGKGAPVKRMGGVYGKPKRTAA
jgi:hypothetical protein